MIGVYKVTQRVKKDLRYSMRPVTEEKLAGHDAIGTRPVELHLGEVTQGKTLVVGNSIFHLPRKRVGTCKLGFLCVSEILV